jgi:hypothetical protein
VLGRPSPRSASFGRILARPRSLSSACLPARPAVPCSRRVGPRRGLELGPDACATRSQNVECGFARARVRAAFRRSSSCPRHDRLPPNPVYPPSPICANHVVYINKVGVSIWKLVTLVNSYSQSSILFNVNLLKVIAFTLVHVANPFVRTNWNESA